MRTSCIAVVLAMLVMSTPSSAGRSLIDAAAALKADIAVQYTFSGPAVNTAAAQASLRTIVAKVLGIAVTDVAVAKATVVGKTTMIQQKLTGFATKAKAVTFAAVNLQTASAMMKLNAALAKTDMFMHSPIILITATVVVVPSSAGRSLIDASAALKADVAVQYTFSGPSVNTAAAQATLRTVVAKVLDIALTDVVVVKASVVGKTTMVQQKLTGFASKAKAVTFAAVNLQTSSAMMKLNGALAKTDAFMHSPIILISASVVVV